MPLDLNQFKDDTDPNHANDDVWLEALLSTSAALGIAISKIEKSGKAIAVYSDKGTIETDDFTIIQPDEFIKPLLEV